MPQTITVQGPQFAIDPGAVVSAYPPDGSTGAYDDVLPSVVLDDASLPWERSLVPGQEQPGEADPTPWVALVVVQDSDLVAPAESTNPVVSGPVGTLLQTTDDVLAPSVVPPDPTVVAQSITISGERFAAVMPTSADIVHLAHCRELSTSAEAGLNAVVIANRLAVSAVGDTAYRAHLVSLEGLQDAIAPNAVLPQKTGSGASGPKDVIMVSLASWTFASTAEGAPFSDLVEGLIAEQAGSLGLTVPVPANATPPATLAARIAAGYVPLEYGLPSGEATFAWYRGPLTPQVAQALPAPPGRTSDGLLVYSQADGVFDVSYAAAWQLGRGLGLADPTFSQSLVRYRQAARSSAALLGQRQTVAHLAGSAPADLLAPNPTRRRLIGALAGGLGERWTAALRAGPGDGPAARLRAPAPNRGRGAVAAALEAEGAGDALADQLAELQAPVASWLASLALLDPLPFANMVPDPAMLPTESVRFFYIDPAWQRALTAGTMSIGVHGSADVALDAKLQPSLDAAVAADLAKLGATGAPLSGMLIRSALVPAWPTLVITATQAGQPLPAVRRDTLSTDVLLCLWSGVPDGVTLAEPYQGLRFGIEVVDGVALRDVTTAGSIGKQRDESVPVTPVGGRVDVAGLAAAIGTKLGIPALGAGDLAIQLVLAPECQSFPSKKAP